MEKISEHQKYRVEHWKETRDREREQGRRYYYKVRGRSYELLGNKCSKCGNSDKRVLQIDHIPGGGSSRKLVNRSGQGARKRILNEIEAGSKDYQLLCANCNIIKKFENQEIKGHLRKEFYKQSWQELSKRKTVEDWKAINKQ